MVSLFVAIAVVVARVAEVRTEVRIIALYTPMESLAGSWLDLFAGSGPPITNITTWTDRADGPGNPILCRGS